MIGETLDGRYHVHSQLGAGAMGEVYLVEHVQLRRREALKILRPRLSATDELVARFRREARAINRLSHPNIVAVYDFGQLPDGRFYLTTEYVEGQGLDQLIATSGPQPLERTLTLLSQLADAVDHAHRQGVIHRDLKPANLMLGSHRGQHDMVKILDFGLAKIVAPDYLDSVMPTKIGEILGTPAYLAPEQVRGIDVDWRCDIYAIGCIAFELLTGAPPFSGKPLDIMRSQLQRSPPRLAERLPAAMVSEALEALIARTLAKAPTERFQTTGELRLAIEELPGFKTRPVRRSYQIIPGATTSTAVPKTAIIAVALAETLHGGSMPTTDPEEARRIFRASLRALAEALLDRGVRDVKLAMEIANVAAFEGRHGRALAELDELDRLADAVDRRRREYESSLRAAISELQFEVRQAREEGSRVDPDLEHQLTMLRQRLDELGRDTTRELDVITERATTLAAERATVEDELGRLYGWIQDRIEVVRERVPLDPSLEELFATVANAKRELG